MLSTVHSFYIVMKDVATLFLVQRLCLILKRFSLISLKKKISTKPNIDSCGSAFHLATGVCKCCSWKENARLGSFLITLVVLVSHDADTCSREAEHSLKWGPQSMFLLVRNDKG